MRHRGPAGLALALALVWGAVAQAQPRREDEPAGAQAFRQIPWPWASDAYTPRLRSWVGGWALTGSNPQAYEVRCEDPGSACLVPLLRTRATASPPLGTASLTHGESAIPWRGHRVVVKAELKAGRIDGWAALWMRIDGANDAPLAFDNMQNRPLRGTSAFRWHRVVLDVPPEAERLTFGVLLHGPGAVFIRELQFEEAEPEEPTTDLMAPLRAQAGGGASPPVSPAAR
jgi:hypothetical protein